MVELTRRSFVGWSLLALLPVHHRPKHRGGPMPTPTPTPPTGPGFMIGRSFAGGPDVVGGLI